MTHHGTRTRRLLRAGTLVGERYSLLGGPLARGGDSVVYKATDVLADGALVAIKVLDGAGWQKDDLLREFFEREVRSLSLVRHENIIGLLHWGESEDYGRWLALEYAPGGSLADEGSRARVWDEPSLLQLLLSCARGLQQAHILQVIHRDLKPSNILFGHDWVPKIADFGVSKLLGRGRSLSTVRQFMTPRYASPEQKEGKAATEVSDIYSLGIVIAELMSRGGNVEPATLVQTAIDMPSYSGPIRSLVRRMTLASQGDRPTASAVIAEALDMLTVGGSATRLRLRITPKVLDRVSVIQGTATRADAIQSVREDLDGMILVSSTVLRGERGDNVFQVLGNRFQYLVVLTSGEERELLAIGVGQPPALALDQARGAALTLQALWQPETVTSTSSNAGAADQFLALFGEANATRQAAQVRGRIGRSLLEKWGAYLEAHKNSQAGKEILGLVKDIRPIDDAGVLTVILAEPPEGPTAANQFDGRMVALSKPDGDQVPLGMIIQAEQEVFVVRPHESVPGEIRGSGGRLVIDLPRELAVIDRQQRALEVLKRNGAVRGGLMDLLMNPSTVEPPIRQPIQPVQQSLDATNLRAVEMGLGAPSMFLIQGPPGTGKTTVIAEFVAQVLERQPEARVLVSSQSNVAVDNVLERLDELIGPCNAVRLGHTEKIAQKLLKYELSTRLGTLATEMHTRAVAAKARLQRMRMMSHADLGALRDMVSQAATASVPEVARDAVSYAQELIGVEVPTEAGMLGEYLGAALDLIGRPSSILERVEALQDEWIDIARAATAFERFLFQSTRVVAGTCVGFAARRVAGEAEYDWVIVDEAGRATPPETLVPMVRGRRFLLVGDQRQLPPILDESAEVVVERQLTMEHGALRTSLFEELFEAVPPESRLTLTKQYRMHPDIGALVATCFYTDKLEHGVDPTTRLLGVTLLGSALKWLDTCNLDASEQRVGTSYRNPTEASLIVKQLRSLDRQAGKQNIPRVIVGVLTAYLPQQELLISRLATLGLDRLPHLEVQAHTVDAAQGKEFDIVFYSAVRSNTGGSIGFLKDERRLNVALSRARDGLVIVGDSRSLTAAGSSGRGNPFVAVKSFFDANPQACHREVLGDA